MPVRVRRGKAALGHVGDLFAEEQDAALVGAQQAVGQLEQDALAHAGGAEQNARLSRRNGEADVFEHRRAVEGDGDVAKDDDRAGGEGCLPAPGSEPWGRAESVSFIAGSQER
jgi:hypothetical protein